MPEEITTPASSETPTADTTSVTDTTPQANADVTSEETEPATNDTTATASDDIESLRKEIARLDAARKKADKEARDRRLENNDLKKFKDTVEAEKLSEKEKLEKKAADLQAKYDTDIRTAKERTLTLEVQLQAARLNIVDPDAASKLLDRSALEYDDDGNATNVEDLLKELVKTKPYLVPVVQQAQTKQAPTTSGGATNPSKTQTNVQTVTADNYAEMVKNYTTLSPDVQKQVQRFSIGRR